MRNVAIITLAIFLVASGLDSKAYGQELPDECWAVNLGEGDMHQDIELGSGIALDPDKNVIVVGSANLAYDCFAEPPISTIYNVLIDCPEFRPDCDDDDRKVYGAKNQVYWKLSQNDGEPLECHMLATCNEPCDDEINHGSAEDVVSTPNGNIFFTGTCHSGFDGKVGGSAENAYIRGPEFTDTVEIDGGPATRRPLKQYFGHSIARYGEEFVVITGTYRASRTSDTDIFVAILVPGEEPEVIEIDSPGNEEGNGIAVDIFGNIYVTGTTDGTFAPNPICSPQSNQRNAVLLKLDSALDEIWRTQFSGDCMLDTVACSVAASCNGLAVYVAGHQSINESGASERRKGMLWKFTDTGIQDWTEILGGPGTELCGVYFYDVATDRSGGVYVCGKTDGNIDHPNRDDPNRDDNRPNSAFVAKYDDSMGAGTFAWAKQISNEITSLSYEQRAAYSITVDKTLSLNLEDGYGDIYIAGQYICAKCPYNNLEYCDAFEVVSRIDDLDCGFSDSLGLFNELNEDESDILVAKFSQNEDLVIKGDVNCDGLLNAFDAAMFFSEFVQALTSGNYSQKLDTDCDGELTGLDIGVFNTMLLNSCD